MDFVDPDVGDSNRYTCSACKVNVSRAVCNEPTMFGRLPSRKCRTHSPTPAGCETDNPGDEGEGPMIDFGCVGSCSSCDPRVGEAPVPVGNPGQGEGRPGTQPGTGAPRSIGNAGCYRECPCAPAPNGYGPSFVPGPRAPIHPNHPPNIPEQGKCYCDDPDSPVGTTCCLNPCGYCIDDRNRFNGAGSQHGSFVKDECKRLISNAVCFGVGLGGNSTANLTPSNCEKSNENATRCTCTSCGCQQCSDGSGGTISYEQCDPLGSSVGECQTQTCIFADCDACSAPNWPSQPDCQNPCNSQNTQGQWQGEGPCCEEPADQTKPSCPCVFSAEDGSCAPHNCPRQNTSPAEREVINNQKKNCNIRFSCPPITTAPIVIGGGGMGGGLPFAGPGDAGGGDRRGRGSRGNADVFKTNKTQAELYDGSTFDPTTQFKFGPDFLSGKNSFRSETDGVNPSLSRTGEELSQTDKIDRSSVNTVRCVRIPTGKNTYENTFVNCTDGSENDPCVKYSSCNGD